MRRPHIPDPHSRLLPAGRRWGFGAHSLLPYLQMALNARPGEDAENISNPVFPQMQNTLDKLRRRH
jgi:hypothetical protein